MTEYRLFFSALSAPLREIQLFTVSLLLAASSHSNRAFWANL